MHKLDSAPKFHKTNKFKEFLSQLCSKIKLCVFYANEVSNLFANCFKWKFHSL